MTRLFYKEQFPCAVTIFISYCDLMNDCQHQLMCITICAGTHVPNIQHGGATKRSRHHCNVGNVRDRSLKALSGAATVNTTVMDAVDLHVLTWLERVLAQFGPHSHCEDVCQRNGAFVLHKFCENRQEGLELLLVCFIIPNPACYTIQSVIVLAID